MTSLKQTGNEYLIKFSENHSAPKLENRKTSPCSPRAPNLLHVLPSRMVGWNKLCNPDDDDHYDNHGNDDDHDNNHEVPWEPPIITLYQTLANQCCHALVFSSF